MIYKSHKRKLYLQDNQYEDNEYDNDTFLKNWLTNITPDVTNKNVLTYTECFFYLMDIIVNILFNIIIPYLTFDTVNILNNNLKAEIYHYTISILSFIAISVLLRSIKYTFIIFITILQLSPIIKNLNKSTSSNTIINISFWLNFIIIIFKSVDIKHNNKLKLLPKRELDLKQILVINLQLTNIIILSSRFNQLLQVAIYLLINIQIQILIPLKYNTSYMYKLSNIFIVISTFLLDGNIKHLLSSTSILQHTIVVLLFLVMFVLLKYMFTNHIIKNKLNRKNIQFFQTWEIGIPSI
ncbi:uncharacterized protein HGUI_02234 [Hanseniaspora guilliermondii]|uniref:Uncharacterized protein n=1 Tax=Hanseniaspora guilliermondii TaxID=56406 RepID=A0A1L0B0U7_9ASCO|nr:uncharacterized protein HGUI_02234 [Hanseniaspora guilliermondii]